MSYGIQGNLSDCFCIKMQSRKDSVSFDKVKARYIKIIAEVTPKLPAWHSMPGEKAFLFVDEIGVE